MKKILVLIVFIFSVAGSIFAANPAEDFEYSLNDDFTSVDITKLKNNKDTYIIPKSIDGMPVRRVFLGNFKGFRNVSNVTITLSDSISFFHYSKTDDVFFCPVTIDGLSDNLVDFFIFAEKQNPWDISQLHVPETNSITVKGSIDKLKSLERVVLENVNLENTTVICRKTWKLYSFFNTNIKDLSFEEGIGRVEETYEGKVFDNTKAKWVWQNLTRVVVESHIKGRMGINLFNRDGADRQIWGFAYNSKLTKVTIPKDVYSIGHDTFFNCSQLSEIIFPEDAGNIFRGDWQSKTFKGTAFPMKAQALIRQKGYQGEF